MYYSIIYQSKAIEGLTNKEVQHMLIKAKLKNKKIGVTGCIVHCNQKFVQIIEGEKQSVIDLYDDIRSDKRHYKVTTLISTSSKDTLWDEWSMAFYNFSDDFEQNKSSRILLETYFDNAHPNQKSSDVFLLLKKSVLELVKDN